MSVYRKPTHTDEYLNFMSNHSDNTKLAVISALFRRAKEIVSEPIQLEKENKRIAKVLAANDYAKETVKKIKKRMEKPVTPRDIIEEPENVKYVSIPYVRGISEKIRRILSSQNIKCAFYSNNTLRKFLSKPKDKIPKDRQNNIVYKIPCKDCPANYIGESKRTFETRSKEHKRAIRNGDVDKNEMAEHCWKNDHTMNWDEREIIDFEQNLVSRKIKESIHSVKDKHHINSISYSLPDIWIPCLSNKSDIRPTESAV